jgi:hypothetical protein
MIKFSPSIKHNSQKIKIKKLGLKKDIWYINNIDIYYYKLQIIFLK